MLRVHDILDGLDRGSQPACQQNKSGKRPSWAAVTHTRQAESKDLPCRTASSGKRFNQLNGILSSLNHASRSHIPLSSDENGLKQPKTFLKTGDTEQFAHRGMKHKTQATDGPFLSSITVNSVSFPLFDVQSALQPGAVAAKAAAVALRSALAEVTGKQPTAVQCDANIPIWWLLRHASLLPLCVLSSFVPNSVGRDGTLTPRALNTAEHHQVLEPSAVFRVCIRANGKTYGNYATPTAMDRHVAHAWSQLRSPQREGMGESANHKHGLATKSGGLDNALPRRTIRALRTLHRNRASAALWSQVYQSVLRLVPPPVHAALTQCVLPLWDTVGLSFDVRRAALLEIVATVHHGAAAHGQRPRALHSSRFTLPRHATSRSTGVLEGPAFGQRYQLTTIARQAVKLRQHVADLKGVFGAVAPVHDSALDALGASDAHAPTMAADVFWPRHASADSSDSLQTRGTPTPVGIWHEFERCQLRLLGILLATAAFWPCMSTATATACQRFASSSPAPKAEPMAAAARPMGSTKWIHVDDFLARLQTQPYRQPAPATGVSPRVHQSRQVLQHLQAQANDARCKLQELEAKLVQSFHGVRMPPHIANSQMAEFKLSALQLQLQAAYGVDLVSAMHLTGDVKAWVAQQVTLMRMQRMSAQRP